MCDFPGPSRTKRHYVSKKNDFCLDCDTEDRLDCEDSYSEYEFCDFDSLDGEKSDVEDSCRFELTDRVEMNGEDVSNISQRLCSQNTVKTATSKQ